MLLLSPTKRTKPSVAIALAMCLLLGGCNVDKYSLPKSETAVFSWETDVWETGGLNDSKLLEETGVSAVFQEVPKGHDSEVLDALCGFDVYLLAGDPYMTLDEMEECVPRAQQYYRGLVLDVEPYGQEEWSDEAEQEAILDRFCEQIKALYAYAQEHDTELILCVPFWYDELGFDAQLDTLVQSSDGICVMNYSRGNERANIEGEYRLAGKYHKKLWTAYELAPCDGKEVQQINTYHDQGLSAVLDNYESNFSDTNIGLALHDLTSICQANDATSSTSANNTSNTTSTYGTANATSADDT